MLNARFDLPIYFTAFATAASLTRMTTASIYHVRWRKTRLPRRVFSMLARPLFMVTDSTMPALCCFARLFSPLTPAAIVILLSYLPLLFYYLFPPHMPFFHYFHVQPHVIERAMSAAIILAPLSLAAFRLSSERVRMQPQRNQYLMASERSTASAAQTFARHRSAAPPLRSARLLMRLARYCRTTTPR